MRRVHPVQDVASLRDLAALERTRNGLFSGKIGRCVNVLHHRDEACFGTSIKHARSDVASPVTGDPSHSKFDPTLICRWRKFGSMPSSASYGATDYFEWHYRTSFLDYDTDSRRLRSE